MELSLRRWKPRQLLATWATYWVGLVGIGLGPTLLASWRATRLPPGQGSIQAGVDAGVLNVSVIESGVKTFSASTPFSTAMLWLVGPPLVLWVIWLFVRQRSRDDASAVAGARAPDALPVGGGPVSEIDVARAEPAAVSRQTPR